MASYADMMSAWGAPATALPPPDDGGQASPPISFITPPAATAQPTAPKSFTDMQKAWADTSPPPPGFKDDNAPSLGKSAKDAAQQLGVGAVETVGAAPGMAGDLQSLANNTADRVSNRAMHFLAREYQTRVQGKPWTDQDEKEFWAGANALSSGPDGIVAGATAAAGVPALGQETLPTSQQTSAAFQAMTGALPDPQTPAGRYARTVGNFLPFAIAPEGLLSEGTAKAIGRLGTEAVAPGLGSQAASDATDDPALKPLSAMVGGMAGGASAAGATKAAAAVGNAVTDSPAVAKAVASTPGLRSVGANMQENIAARRFADSVSDMPAFLEQLKPKPDGDAAVPGFNPTTYQLTGDPGVGQLELAAKAGDDRAAQFLTRTDQQKAAQAQAAQGLTAPGDPAAVAQMVQDHSDAIDAAADQARETAFANARQKTFDALGEGEIPDTIGQELRSHLDAASATSAQRYRDLYKAVNPNGDLGASTTALQQRAQELYSEPNLSATAQGWIHEDEKAHLNQIGDYDPVVSFQNLVDLKSQIAASMRNLRMDPRYKAAAGRLGQLMQPVQEAISGAVQDRAADDAEAVSQGRMAPEDSLEAQIQALQQKWGTDVVGARAYAGDELSRTGTGTVQGPGRGTSFDPGTPGAAVPSGGQSLRPSSGPGVPPQAYRLPTEADRQALRAADNAFAEHIQTYHEGPLKPIMAPGARAGEYRTPDYAVPRQVLRNGPAGYRAAKAYLDGANGTPDAVEALKSAMTETLRPKVKDGMVSGTDLAAWKNRYTHSLRAIEEAAPGYSAQFDDAAKASDAVLQSARAKVEQQRAFKASAIGKLLGVDDPEGVVARVGRMITSDDGAAKMREAVKATEANPAAADGLRNAVGRWIARQVTSLDKIGTTDEHAVESRPFRKLLAKNEPALREVLTPGQMHIASRIAESMDQAQRSVKGNRLEGGPDTAQKLAAERLFKKDGTTDHVANLGLWGALVEGASLGYEHSGLKGAALGAAPAGAAYLIKTLRSAGLHDIQDIAFDAVMNPARAQNLMRRLSPNDFRSRRLDGALRASFIRQADQEPDQGGSPPPNEPPPTGPFSRGGGPESITPTQSVSPSSVRGSSSSSTPVDSERASPPRQPNIPLSGAQARTLRAAGYNALDIRGMTSQERADAVRQAEAAGFSPKGRITPADRSAMGGALPHGDHPGRSGDGRFAQSGDILAHPDLQGRIEPTWHPEAEATQQEILAHEARLKAMAAQLPPDASIRDLSDATNRASDDVLAMVRAYHGTPHDVDRFDSTKIGTGEGNQAYGHGLYFAEHPDVAEGYRKQLAVRLGDDFKVGAQSFKRSDLLGDSQSMYDHIVDSGGNIDQAIKESHDAVASRMRRGDYEGADKWAQRAASLENWRDQGFSMGRGNVYQVAIDREPEHFLDYDAPLSKQSIVAKRALKKAFGLSANDQTLQGLYPTAGDLYRTMQQGRSGPAGVSAKLRDAGLAGIRYLDQGSRGTPASGTRNYVVFDDKDIAITHRNGKPVAPAERDQVLAMARPTQTAGAPEGSAGTAGAPAGLTLTNPKTGASVQARGSTSLGGALERFDISRDPSADNLQRVSHLAVGDRLSRLAGNTPVYVVGPAEMRTLADKRVNVGPGRVPTGFYDAKSGHIIVSEDALRDPREASHLIMHEGLHAALMRTINESENARALVEHLRQASAAIHVGRGGTEDDHYGFRNVHEFMSEALSNPEFQRHLASMPADARLVRAFGLQSTTRTMWDAVVGAMRRVLGLKPEDRTYLDAAMRLGGHLLDAAQARAGAEPRYTPPVRPAPPPMPRPPPPPPRQMPPIGAIQGGSGLLSGLATMFGVR